MPKTKKNRRGAPEQPRGSVLLVESGPSAKRTEAALAGAGFEVSTVSTPEQVSESARPDLVVLAQTAGKRRKAVVRSLRVALEDPKVPLILVLPRGTSKRRAAAAIEGVDASLVRPLSETSLVAVAEAYTRVRYLERRLLERERQLEQALMEGGRVDPRTGFYSFEVFKSLLAAEVKRARRYKYPFSMAIAAFDDLSETRARLGDELADVLEGGLRRAISRSLRDLDLPVAYGSGQVLLVMPHTPRKGARVMLDRLKKSVASTRMDGPDGKVGTTVSIGLAAYEGEGEVSFGDMAQEAAAALRIAAERGGNRVAEVPVTRRRRSSEDSRR